MAAPITSQAVTNQAVTNQDDRVAALAAAWEQKDLSVAALVKDREAAKEARGLRELVCDLVVSAASPRRELLTALHSFGYLLGEKGATPSYVSLTVESARTVLGAVDGERLDPSAYAAVAEGYFAAMREAFAAEALAEWLPPAGIVRLSADAFAVAAHLPSREPEDISTWATQVARYLKERGAKNAHIDGDAELVTELRDSLLLAGIDVATGPTGPSGGSGSGTSQEPKKGFLSKLLG